MRGYICSDCARASGGMPRVSQWPIRGTEEQKGKVTKHTGTYPASQKNGIFDGSDTNTLRALRDEASAHGLLEVEPGSTNVVYGFGRRIGTIEAYGHSVAEADGVRVLKSSNAAESHFYPIATADLGKRTCRVCGEPIDD